MSAGRFWGSSPFTDLGLHLGEMLQDPGDGGVLSEEKEKETLAGTFEKGLHDTYTLLRACAWLWRRAASARGLHLSAEACRRACPGRSDLLPPLLTQARSLQTRRLSRFLLRVAVQIPAAPGPSRLCATSSALSPEA